MKACSRLRSAAALVAVVALALTGCANSSGAPASTSIRGVEVSGDFGKEPVVRIAAPLKLASTQSQFAIVGTGPQIQIDQLHVVQLTLYNARTGTKAAATSAPVAVKSSDDSLFPALVEALAGKPQGSRVLVALTAADAFGSGGVPPAGITASDPVVVVADVLAVPPTSVLRTAEGAAQRLPDGSPRVPVLAGDPTAVDVPAGSTAPSELTVFRLVTGTGPPVRDHSLVTVDYLGQDWGSRIPFVDTYFKEPSVQPVGTVGSIPAWDRALVGLPAGSRVLVIDPDPPTRVPGETRPAEHGTIAWVIDVLGVS